jgi:hypothetical protein
VFDRVGCWGGECLVIVSVAVLVGATHGNIAIQYDPKHTLGRCRNHRQLGRRAEVNLQNGVITAGHHYFSLARITPNTPPATPPLITDDAHTWSNSLAG